MYWQKEYTPVQLFTGMSITTRLLKYTHRLSTIILSRSPINSAIHLLSRVAAACVDGQW